MDSLERMRSSNAQLIYNIDHNMKSISAPETKLIKCTITAKGARLLLINLKTYGNKVSAFSELREVKGLRTI